MAKRYAFPAKIFPPFFVHNTFTIHSQNTIFTQVTIDGLTKNKTKNPLPNDMVILNWIGGDTISHNLSN